MAMRFTTKEIKGFFLAKADGGAVFNDSYNIPNFGISQAKYSEMRNFLTDKFGLYMPNTFDCKEALKKAEKNNKGLTPC